MVSPGLLKWAQGVIEENEEAERKRTEAAEKAAKAAAVALEKAKKEEEAAAVLEKEQKKQEVLVRSAKIKEYLEKAKKDFFAEYGEITAISKELEEELKEIAYYDELIIKAGELKTEEQINEALRRIEGQSKLLVERLSKVVLGGIFYIKEAERLATQGDAINAVKAIQAAEDIAKESRNIEKELEKLTKYKEEIGIRFKKIISQKFKVIEEIFEHVYGQILQLTTIIGAKSPHGEEIYRLEGLMHRLRGKAGAPLEKAELLVKIEKEIEKLKGETKSPEISNRYVAITHYISYNLGPIREILLR